jgi:protein-disulfide isomerase
VIDHDVRSGRLRLELRLLSSIGSDSERAARLAGAAALQDRLWAFSDLFYREQDLENSGLCDRLVPPAPGPCQPGLDARRALAQRGSPGVGAALAQAQQEAGRLGVASTPSFFLVRAGRPPQRLEVTALTTGALSQAIDWALRA